MVGNDRPHRDPHIATTTINRSIWPSLREYAMTFQERPHGGSTMNHLASSPTVVLEDLFLGLAYPLRERGKALADLIRGVWQAHVGPLEEIQKAAPAVDKGRELRRSETLGTTEEELLNEDVQGRRHAGRAYPEGARPTNKPR